jgi:hypothetical protein
MSYDEALRAHQEHLQVGMRNREFFDADKLTREVPDPYVSPEEDTGPGTRLTHAELDAAERELAGKYGRVRVNDMIHLTHAESGLGRSENERHAVLGQVVLALRSGEKAVPVHRIARLEGTVLELARQQGTVFGGPAEDEEEVRLSAPAAGLTQETRAMAMSAGQDSADDIAARNPEIFLAHPSKSGVKVTTRTRAHASDLEDYEDPRDTRQPARGGKMHPEVERILRKHGLYFGDMNQSHPPRSPAQRERGQRRAERSGA